MFRDRRRPACRLDGGVRQLDQVGATPFLRRFGCSTTTIGASASLQTHRRCRRDRARLRESPDGNGPASASTSSTSAASCSIALRVIPPQRPRRSTSCSCRRSSRRSRMEQRGLILVTGTTGSGKSTTLAAMIDHINQQRALHIITIEDPIEYAHRDKRSIINQREIGIDVASFAAALRGALRQDPDVILVGEMRDLETIETAILAAETGHLVMCTLHTLDAARDHHAHHLRRSPSTSASRSASSSSSVIEGHHQPAARAARRRQGHACPRSRSWSSTALVRECIAIPKRRPHELHRRDRPGHATYGMQTFDQSLMALFREDLITYEEALAPGDQPRRLRAQGPRHRLHQRRPLGRVRQAGPSREWPGGERSRSTASRPGTCAGDGRRVAAAACLPRARRARRCRAAAASRPGVGYQPATAAATVARCSPSVGYVDDVAPRRATCRGAACSRRWQPPDRR